MRVFIIFSFMLLFLVLFFAILCNSSNAKIDPAFCMGAWLLDEDGNDITANGYHCIINGKPKFVDGKFGKAMDCDGTDDIADAGDQDGLDVGPENFLVVSWLKCAKYDPGDWEAQIIYKFDHTAPRHGYLLAVRGSLDAGNKNKPVFIFGLGDASGIHLFGTKAINDDNWHHLAVTVDRAGSMIMYRDGEIEAQMSIVAYAKQDENNSKEFTIGSEKGVPSRSIKGTIGEVALFKSILLPI
ncbi:TPA: LamG domain-containing protein [bacterium]|nr:LamG domain-containing protein [bacterium]